MFSYLRISSVGLHRHWGPWIVALNKVYNREKKTRRHKIHDNTFLDFNFQSPSFSAVFPPPFSAVVSPLIFLFFYVFPGLPLFFSWQQNMLYSLPWPFGKMLQMPKCNAEFQCFDAFCGHWQSRWQIQPRRSYAPSFRLCYAIEMWNWIYQRFEFAGIGIKTMSAIIYPS